MTSMTLNGPVCKCKAASFRMREKSFVQLAAVDALEERKQRAREEERRERGSRKGERVIGREGRSLPYSFLKVGAYAVANVAIQERYMCVCC